MGAAVQQAQAPTWDDVREQLRGLLGEETYGRWFQTVIASIEQTDRALVLQIAAPDRFQRDWLRDNYSSAIEASWRHLAPGGQVIFTVEERQAPRLERKTAQIIQFPLFPEETRPASNDCARSALFAAIKGKDRRMLDNALLATVDSVKIHFTGKQLNQDDHDTLMQLVFMAKHKPLGEYVTVPARAILKGLGRGTGGDKHEQLKAEIERLTNGGIALRSERYDYIGHLIDEALQDKQSRYWMYRINPRLRQLFSLDNYTLIDWEQRKSLKRKDLARWLQLYLATHAAPFPVKVATLRELSGSRTAELKKFRQLLRGALYDLEDNHDIEDWHIDENDLVHVDRGKAISASQSRHLSRPKGKRNRKK